MDIGGTPPPAGANAPSSLHVPSFSTTFPLPYRVLFLVGLGILLWAINLHVLHLVGLDTGYVLGVRTRSSSEAEAEDNERAEEGAIALTGSTGKITYARSQELFGPVYGLLGAYAAWSFGGWVVFRWLVGADDQAKVDTWRWLPFLTALGAVAGLLAPYDRMWKRERVAFVRSIKRCLTSPIGQPILFCDVITADVLTSFAKVIGDLWVSSCLIFGGKLGASQLQGAGSGLGEWVLPLMVSIPYIIRLRQCLVEWATSDYKNGRPLANALKYASAFPVIVFSAFQKVVVEEVLAGKGVSDLGGDTWHGEHPLFRLWLLSVFVNSLYSFWWDVTNDWGLTFLKASEWERTDMATPSSYSTARSPGGGLMRSPSLAPHRRNKSIVAKVISRLPSLSGPSPAQQSRGHSRNMSLNHARSAPPSPDRSLPTVNGQVTSANGYFPPTPTGSEHPHYAASRANHQSAASVSSAVYPPPSSHSPPQYTHPRGLRPELHFSETAVYYLAIFVDLALRFTWSLKLSSKLHTISEIESGVFMMEVLELLRRWMWVFFRMEWEEIRKTESEAFIRRRGSSRPTFTSHYPPEDDEDDSLLMGGASTPTFSDSLAFPQSSDPSQSLQKPVGEKVGATR